MPMHSIQAHQKQKPHALEIELTQMFLTSSDPSETHSQWMFNSVWLQPMLTRVVPDYWELSQQSQRHYLSFLLHSTFEYFTRLAAPEIPDWLAKFMILDFEQLQFDYLKITRLVGQALTEATNTEPFIEVAPNPMLDLTREITDYQALIHWLVAIYLAQYQIGAQANLDQYSFQSLVEYQEESGYQLLIHVLQAHPSFLLHVNQP